MARIFGLIGILAALVIVMLLVARQLAPVASAPAGGVTSPQQAREIEQQYKKAVEDALKQPQRDVPDDAK